MSLIIRLVPYIYLLVRLALASSTSCGSRSTILYAYYPAIDMFNCINCVINGNQAAANGQYRSRVNRLQTWACGDACETRSANESLRVSEKKNSHYALLCRNFSFNVSSVLLIGKATVILSHLLFPCSTCNFLILFLFSSFFVIQLLLLLFFIIKQIRVRTTVNTFRAKKCKEHFL